MTEFAYKEVGADEGDVDGMILLDGTVDGSVDGKKDGIDKESEGGVDERDVSCRLLSSLGDSLDLLSSSSILLVKCRRNSSSAKSTPIIAVTDCTKRKLGRQVSDCVANNKLSVFCNANSIIME